MNGGTLEHVFHVPNALANLNAMLKPSGAILHVLPCNNWVDHGFYQFSPTLMFDYYAALQFEVLESAIMIFNPRVRSGHYWEIRPAPYGVFGTGLAGALDDKTYLHVVVVRRGSASFERVVPIKSLYARRPVRPKGGPRWFSPYDLSDGTRIDHPNRQIVPLRDIQKSEGLGWSIHVPALKNYSDNTDHPIRSPIVVLEDACALGPPHASHAAKGLAAAELSRIGARICCFPPLTTPIQTIMAGSISGFSRTDRHLEKERVQAMSVSATRGRLSPITEISHAGRVLRLYGADPG